MKIVIAADVKTKVIVEYNLRLIEELDYQTLVYDLGGLGIGKPFTGFKPQIIEDAFSNMEKNELAVYLDGATVLRNRIEELRHDNFDVGLIGDFDQGRFMRIRPNVGFFRNTVDTSDFLKLWIEQGGTDEVLGAMKREGFSLRTFSAKAYSFNLFPDFPTQETKILDFSGPSRREFYRRYLKSFA